jgi:hypothetical protein
MGSTLRGCMHRVPIPSQKALPSAALPAYCLMISATITTNGSVPLFSDQCVVCFPSDQLSPFLYSFPPPPSRCSVNVPCRTCTTAGRSLWLWTAFTPQPHDQPAPYKRGHQDKESFRVHARPPFHLCRDEEDRSLSVGKRLYHAVRS